MRKYAKRDVAGDWGSTYMARTRQRPSERVASARWKRPVGPTFTRTDSERCHLPCGFLRSKRSRTRPPVACATDPRTVRVRRLLRERDAARALRECLTCTVTRCLTAVVPAAPGGAGLAGAPAGGAASAAGSVPGPIGPLSS